MAIRMRLGRWVEYAIYDGCADQKNALVVAKGMAGVLCGCGYKPRSSRNRSFAVKSRNRRHLSFLQCSRQTRLIVAQSFAKIAGRCNGKRMLRTLNLPVAVGLVDLEDLPHLGRVGIAAVVPAKTDVRHCLVMPHD